MLLAEDNYRSQGSGFVALCVCVQNISKSSERILGYFQGRMPIHVGLSKIDQLLERISGISTKIDQLLERISGILD